MLFAPVRGAAAELVTFTNGFQMTITEHHQADGQYVLLAGEGAIQVPAQLVASIEPVPSAPAPPPAATPPTVAAQQNLASAPDVGSLLAEAAEAAGLPATLVLSVAKVESAFVVSARSPKGAIGLMQLMPATAAELGVTAEDVRANAFGGAQYLRQLLIRYNGEARLALAAYNAGPANVDRFHDVPPIAETQRYVALVLNEYYRLEAGRQAAAKPAVSDTAAAASHSRAAKAGAGN